VRNPDLIAALDQLRAAMADVAEALGSYRHQLMHAGFDSEDALELCLDLQRVVIFGDRSPQPD